MNKLHLIIIIASLLLPLHGIAQTVKVLSAEDQKPVSYAAVVYQWLDEGTEHAAVTNISGIATLYNNKPENNDRQARITVSTLGFEKLSDTIRASESKTVHIKPTAHQLNDVVITAQYSQGNTEQAVHKVRVISSEELQQRGSTNLKELLSQEMNIRVSNDQVLGSNMTLQGVSGENVKILIDGVPVIGRQGGNIDLAQINLNNIERVEIVEGPLSVNYGTNALGGVINLITKKTQYARIEAGLNSYCESVGQYNIDGKVGYRTGKNQFSINGGSNFFQGWSEKDTSRFKEWKPREQYFGDFQYNRYIKNLMLQLSSGWFNEKITNNGHLRLQ